jgi:hypothetical protein
MNDDWHIGFDRWKLAADREEGPTGCVECGQGFVALCSQCRRCGYCCPCEGEE